MAIEWIATSKLVFGGLFKKMFFILVRLLFLVPQAIWWRICGIQEQIRRNQDPKTQNTKCAQVFKVLSWSKPDFLLPLSLRDFILMHDEFVDPKYVLENDNVTLCFLDPHEDVAVFGQGEEGQLLWKSDTTPFLTYTLFTRAKRLIVVPMYRFNEMCDSLPDPQKPLILVTHTARTGSTLLLQAFEQTNRIIGHSEPYPVNTMAVMYKKKGDCEETRRFTRRIIRMYCKPIKSIKNPVGYVIKPSGASGASMEAVKAVYKDAVMFYMYRDLLKVSPSFFKLSFVLPSVRLVYLLCRVSGNLVESIFAKANFPTENTNRTVQDDLSCGVFQALVTFGPYHDMRKRGYNVQAIPFEEMLKNKEECLKAIFKICGLPLDLVPDALRAFDQDSQRNTPLSKENMAKLPTLAYSEEDKIRASQIMLDFGHPPLDQPWRLEGTIDIKAILNN